MYFKLTLYKLFFLIKYINLMFKTFIAQIFYVWETFLTRVSFNLPRNFNLIINSSSYKLFFKKQSFNADYIYYWDRGVTVSFLDCTNSSLFKKNFFEKSNYFFKQPLFFNFMFFKKFIFFFKNLAYENFKRTFSFGFYYIRGLFFIFFIDACLTDDEPLWEPIEWSLVQTWILFIFTFAWIAENLIVSRYGSYAGRDKRVWMAWYKTFWLIEGYYVINYGIVSVFVMLPFYFELNYNLSFVYSWWHWYSRVFFFKFITTYSIVLSLAYLLQLNIKWLNWKKNLILIVLINVFIAYLIYTHFILVFFGYFTDPIWYQKSRSVDYIQLSHEPSRWGWGFAKKDHFTYHNVKTVFWFKNDGPFAASFLMFHLFLFICLFLLSIFWLTLLRRLWSTKEISITFTTYCVSSLRQFFYFFLFLYIFVFISFLINYLRLPLEIFYFIETNSWLTNFFHIIFSYLSLFSFR